MTDAVKHTPNQIDEIGNGLASRAEKGALGAVNKELQEIRSQNPKEYVSIVKALENRNFDHVQSEHDYLFGRNNAKYAWPSKEERHIPELIIVDTSKDKKHPNYQVQIK